MSQQKKVRTIILTCSVTLITVFGVWYGAGLKTEQGIKKSIHIQKEAPPAERIAQLEQSRSGLMAKKIGLERKIAELEERQRVLGRIDDSQETKR